MRRPPPLTDQQKIRLRLLEPQLRAAARKGDYEKAKRIAADLQRLLRPTGHHTRLLQAKNWLYEAAMESGRLITAVQGFRGVREMMSPRTRVHLEATALLAICHLRRKEVGEAERLMAEVLQSENVITSERRRNQFRVRIVQRFEEETVLSALQGSGSTSIDLESAEADAAEVVRTKTEDEILYAVGGAVPNEAIEMLLRVHKFAMKQLPASGRKLLPPPERVAERREVGRTVVSAAKRVVWRSLCDPDNDVYKAWCTNGLMGLLDRKVLVGAVALALSGVQFGAYALAVSITAFVLKLGLDVVCETWKPEGVMIHTTER